MKNDSLLLILIDRPLLPSRRIPINPHPQGPFQNRSAQDPLGTG